MSKKCELTGKIPLKGHKVSHANNKTKRRFLPNLKKVKFKSEILKKSLKLFTTTKSIMKTIPICKGLPGLVHTSSNQVIPRNKTHAT